MSISELSPHLNPSFSIYRASAGGCQRHLSDQLVNVENEKCSGLEVSVNISTFTHWGIELYKLLRVLQRGLWPHEQGLEASEKRTVNLTSSSGVLVWTKVAIWSKAGLRSPTDLINIECFRSLPHVLPYLLRVLENDLKLYNIILKCGVGRHKICQRYQSF